VVKSIGNIKAGRDRRTESFWKGSPNPWDRNRGHESKRRFMVTDKAKAKVLIVFYYYPLIIPRLSASDVPENKPYMVLFKKKGSIRSAVIFRVFYLTILNLIF